MADTQLIEQEKNVKKLKRDLEVWREIILPLNSVLLWDKQWYPGMIAGLNTSVFLILWAWDPSVLTLLSIILLCVTITDYFAPTLISSMNRPDSWTGAKEKTFDGICRSLTMYQKQLKDIVEQWRTMKTTRPKCYYCGTMLVLLFLTWVGSTINNLLLTYLVVSVVLFLPGLQHHGLLDKYGSCITNKVSEIINKAKLKVETKDKVN